VNETPDLLVFNGKITTMDAALPETTAFAARDGRFVAVGTDKDVVPLKGKSTTVVDLHGQRVIPGLIDNHMHLIRGGLFYNLELRWDGVRSLAQGMQMLREQVARTPPPHWVRVVGGFTSHQFREKRMPTLDEINQAAPETPVFIMHMHQYALMNRAALRAVGYTKDTPDPPDGEIVRQANGEPTGLILAKPTLIILYATLNKGPKLPPELQMNSTRQFMRELNRLGLTSVVDAGGSSQSYPGDYEVIRELSRQGLLTVRIAYNLYPQRRGHELEDVTGWIDSLRFDPAEEYFRFNGAGENLVFSAADYDNFAQPRPAVPETLESEIEPVFEKLFANRWAWRLHATYNETITHALNALDRVSKRVPIEGTRWFLDHCETIDERNIDRVAALGGNIAIQNRAGFQAEAFRERYGNEIADHTPPIKRMLQAGLEVGAGTDATRSASYNPWLCISWLVTGRGTSGMVHFPPAQRFERLDALWMYTGANAYFSGEAGTKGQIKAGQYADAVVLSGDYLTVPDDDIRELTSVLTVVGGRIVWADGLFAAHRPPLPPALPEWSPIRYYGGYQNAGLTLTSEVLRSAARRC
jgi:predicted amidohydrolase YtcJ